MKQIKKLLLIFLLTLGISTTNGYVFGIKSADNTITNIVEIQNKYNFDFKIIGFIFDPRSEDVLWTMNNLNKFLGTGKIYHITLSPNSYSAKQVAEGIFDKQYRQFFQTIKENNLKVIFRTMHEMNGGRYPRSSNPEQFKEARIHVRELSREEGLDQNNILFDFSVNHRDMPTNETPSQNAKLITCTPKNKYKTITEKIFIKTGYKTETITKKEEIPQSLMDKLLNKNVEYKTTTQTRTISYPIYKTETKEVQNCFSFEDYYPGNKFVDIVGVTFYNRGKATYSRQRYSPDRILNDKEWNTLQRLKNLNKPIFIDEVGTTAIRYNENYNFKKSQNFYNTESEKKNQRLIQLKNFVHTNQNIIGLMYFNVDYTEGLSIRTPGEADRAIINTKNGKFYTGIYELYNGSTQNETLRKLFNQSQKKENNNIGNSNISYNKKQDLAKLMVETWGKENTITKLQSIKSSTNNTTLTQLINDLLGIIEKSNGGITNQNTDI